MKNIVQLLYPNRKVLCQVVTHRWASLILRQHFVASSIPNTKDLCPKCGRKLLKNSNTPREAGHSMLSNFVDDDFDFEEAYSKVTKSLSKDIKYTLEDENVFIIQPIDYTDFHKITTPQLELAESTALVESLPKWKVGGHYMNAIDPGTPLFFHKHTLADVAAKIRTIPRISCVFVSVEQLSPDRRAMFRKVCEVDKIYDRYTLVLQIFKLRARTKAAKLQVALAEIPYARNHLLHGISSSEAPQRQKQGFVTESYQHQLKNLFQHKEKKLRKELQLLSRNRELHRSSREKANLPVVAVVGYTNAGKTSLIKALSKSEKMEPKDQLFATLDVTAHSAMFPNKLRYILVDTVGFLSNLPLELFDAFSATMEDMLCANVIVHVRDEGHPDRSNQLKNVISILSKLKLRPNLLRNIVEVRNKIDLAEPRDIEATGSPPTAVWPKMKKIALKNGQRDLRPAVVCRVSATRGLGLPILVDALQDVVMIVTARRRVEMLVPADGEHLSWLEANACVEGVLGEGDYQLRLMAIMTKPQLNKFLHAFDGVEVLRELTSDKTL